MFPQKLKYERVLLGARTKVKMSKIIRISLFTIPPKLKQFTFYFPRLSVMYFSKNMLQIFFKIMYDVSLANFPQISHVSQFFLKFLENIPKIFVHFSNFYVRQFFSGITFNINFFSPKYHKISLQHSLNLPFIFLNFS